MVAMARALMPSPRSCCSTNVRRLRPACRTSVHPTKRINRTGVTVLMVEQNARRCLQICDAATCSTTPQRLHRNRAEPDQRPSDRALPRNAGARLTAPGISAREKGPARSAAPSRVGPATAWASGGTRRRSSAGEGVVPADGVGLGDWIRGARVADGCDGPCAG